MNAVRHGLTAEIAVLPGEDEEEYRRELESLFEILQPVGAVEGFLVTRLAVLMRKTRRSERIEAGILQIAMLDNEAQRVRLESVPLQSTVVTTEAEHRARALEMKAREPASGAVAVAFLHDVVGARALEALSRYERGTWREMRQILAMLNDMKSQRGLDTWDVVDAAASGLMVRNGADEVVYAAHLMTVADVVTCEMVVGTATG